MCLPTGAEMSRRYERLNEQVKRETAEILRLRVRDPRVIDVRVTGAEVTSDLWLARIYVRLPQDREARAQARKGLAAATPYIRRELGQVLRLRRVPELRFEEDRTAEAAERIESLLKEAGIEADDEAPDASDP